MHTYTAKPRLYIYICNVFCIVAHMSYCLPEVFSFIYVFDFLKCIFMSRTTAAHFSCIFYYILFFSAQHP